MVYKITLSSEKSGKNTSNFMHVGKHFPFKYSSETAPKKEIWSIANSNYLIICSRFSPTCITVEIKTPFPLAFTLKRFSLKQMISSKRLNGSDYFYPHNPLKTFYVISLRALKKMNVIKCNIKIKNKSIISNQITVEV